jgi:hypothetical protein
MSAFWTHLSGFEHPRQWAKATDISSRKEQLLDRFESDEPGQDGVSNSAIGPFPFCAHISELIQNRQNPDYWKHQCGGDQPSVSAG